MLSLISLILSKGRLNKIKSKLKLNGGGPSNGFRESSAGRQVTEPRLTH